MTYAYVYNAYSDPVENADADHQHDRQLRKASMKYVNEKRELQINAAILRATTHTNSRHPSPFKIKTNPGVDALAKEAQNTIGTKHKKRPTHYKDTMRPQATRSTFARLCPSLAVS